MEKMLEYFISCLDYYTRYFILKVVLTMFVSLLVMSVILLLRRWIGKKHVFLRAALWFFMLPTPFLWGFRYSVEHPTLRGRFYALLYEIVLGNAAVSKIYLAGIVLIAAVMVVRRKRLIQKIKRLEIYDMDMSDELGSWFQKHVIIHISPEVTTPFTVGSFRPRIVLSKYFLEEFHREELLEILRHEYNHIRRGHLLIYHVIDWFRAIWYINPLVHYCGKKCKEDLELVCDYVTVQKSHWEKTKYGVLILRSLKCVGETGGPGRQLPALASEKSFSAMKQRITLISQYPEQMKRAGKFYACAGLLLFALCMVCIPLSYPLYTPLEDHYLYSYEGVELIIQDNKEFNAAVSEKKDGLLVNNRVVREILETKGYSQKPDQGFWISYGGYMKLPGIGGGGDVVAYFPYQTTEEYELIPYNEKGTLEKVLNWCLQYM